MRRALDRLIGVSASVGATALLLTASAQAGGFASARFGGEHGHPTTDNATAIYYNPAGLALGSGTRIFAEGLVVYRDATYERPAGAIRNVEDGATGTPTEAVDANSGKATVGNIITSPFLGVVTDFGVKNLGVGLAVYAPFGGQASWDKNDKYKDSEAYPGAVDGVARWATMDGAVKEIYLSTGVAYRLEGPRISIGATASLVSESLDTVRARTPVGNDDLVRGDGAVQEGRSHVDVSGLTYAAGFGVIWEAVDDLHIGLSYQSQPGFGETTQEGQLHTKFGSSGANTTDIDFTQELPDVTRLGIRFKPKDNLELRFAADYTRWSVFEKQCLMDANNANANCTLDEDGGLINGVTEGVIVNQQRNWKDTYGVRVGGSYWLDKDKEIAGGITYDSNAVPDETIDPALIDMNKIVATLGGRFRIMDNILLNASYTHVYYISRDVAPRDRDAMGDEVSVPAPSSTPDMAGSYKQMIGLVNLGVEYQF